MIYWVEVTEYLQRKIKFEVIADNADGVVSSLLFQGQGRQVEPAVITHLCQADIEFGLKERKEEK